MTLEVFRGNPRLVIPTPWHTDARDGVGKSSLAIACAKLLANAGKKPLVVDCDMLGTSLADGLRLVAPQMMLTDDGALDWDRHPTRTFHSPEETMRLRHVRRYAPLTPQMTIPSMPPPFLNDMMRYVDQAIEE